MHTRRQPRKRRPRSFRPPLYPLAPTDTRDGAALARGAVLWVHARTRNKKTKKAIAGKKYKEAVSKRELSDARDVPTEHARGKECL